MELEKVTTKQQAIAALEELYGSESAGSNDAEEVSHWERKLNQLTEIGKQLGVTELEFVRAQFQGTSPKKRQDLVAVYIDNLGEQKSWDELLDDVRNLVTAANEFGLKIR